MYKNGVIVITKPWTH